MLDLNDNLSLLRIDNNNYIGKWNRSRNESRKDQRLAYLNASAYGICLSINRAG